jgi:hypothetical protein
MTRLTKKPNFRVPWTEEQFEALAAMLDDGKTVPEIAKVMGRSQEAVRAKAWVRGLLPVRTDNRAKVGSAVSNPGSQEMS